jgi:hypothetical protein
MKVYHIPGKPSCPLRVQTSDDLVAAALQVRDAEGCPFYWLIITPELAQLLIREHGMVTIFELPDTPADTVL